MKHETKQNAGGDIKMRILELGVYPACLILLQFPTSDPSPKPKPKPKSFPPPHCTAGFNFNFKISM